MITYLDALIFSNFKLTLAMLVAVLFAIFTNALNGKIIEKRNEARDEDDLDNVIVMTKSGYAATYALIVFLYVGSFFAVVNHFDQIIDVTTVLHLILAMTLVFIMVLDVQECQIPNLLIYVLAILAAMIILQKNDLDSYAIIDHAKSGAMYMLFSLVLSILLHFRAKTDSIEMDDVKFSFIIGFLLGVGHFATFILLSGVVGIFISFIWQRVIGKTSSPFTQVISVSGFLCLLYGEIINPIKILEMFV